MLHIEAIMFDVFGTLVDWRTGVADASGPTLAAKGIDMDPLAFADAWRDEYQPSMERIRAGSRQYVPLDKLHLENLETILKKFGLENIFDPDEKMELNRGWEKLPPWPDTVQCLQRLKQRCIIAPCSNGSIALMTRLARHGGLQWDAIVGADIAQDYKPAHQAYLKSAAALGCKPETTLMVAAHNSDLEAAAGCGLMTAFFPRPTEHGANQTIDLQASGIWDFNEESLTKLTDRILASG